MVIAETVPRENLPRKEKMPEAELGNLLAAVGNHEAKALLLASMVPETAYPKIELHRLMIMKQGEYLGSVGWRIHPKTLLAYCEDILSVGAVRVGLLNTDLETDRYEKTGYGENTATPLAGHLLAFVEGHPDVSLIDLFGGNGAAIARLKIYKRLIESGQPMRYTDLVRGLELNKQTADYHLERLAQHDIISYEGRLKGDPISVFIPKKTDDPVNSIPEYRTDLILTREVYGILSNHPEGLFHEEIYKMVIEQEPRRSELKPKVLRTRIYNVLNFLVREGVISKGKFSRFSQTEFKLTDAQRDTLTELVSILNRFSSQDQKFLEEGKSKANQIVNTPARFVTILARAKEASSQANRIDPVETQKEIITILYLHPGIGNTQIQEYLKKEYERDITRSWVAELTRRLRRDGRIAVVSKGASFRYSVQAS